RRSGGGRNVTFPARQYSVNGERRSFALLRPIVDATAQERVRQLIGPKTPTADEPQRGLDHGAYVPLTVMYPGADIPVLQISMPSLDAAELLELGKKLAPLRDEGVLIMGSGFMTHGLPFLRDFHPDAPAPSWSKEFDAWAAESLAKGDVDALVDYKRRAPGLPYAHPTVDHFVPLFVSLGASLETADSGRTVIDGYFLGLSKRSLQFE
ncbi:MAG: class III extradiol ring-cleavage dioxygenase, partial [Chloroflexota bacterium]